MVWKIHFRLEFASPESILIRRWGKWDTSSTQLQRTAPFASAFPSSPSRKFCSALNLLKTKCIYLRKKKKKGEGKRKKKKPRQNSNPSWYFYSAFNDMMVSHGILSALGLKPGGSLLLLMPFYEGQSACGKAVSEGKGWPRAPEQGDCTCRSRWNGITGAVGTGGASWCQDLGNRENSLLIFN